MEAITREELFMAAAAGSAVTLPEPITRREKFLKAIADAVSSGGASPDAIKEAVDAYLAENPVESYTLPVATSTVLGGVKPVAVTDEMTEPVGVDASGKLFTKPGEGGGIDVSGAAVGQIVKVASVDDNGVPTAWEPADLPSGGGGDGWETIADITVEEETTLFKYTLGKKYSAFKVLFCSATFTDGNDALILALNSQWNAGHLIRQDSWTAASGLLYFEFITDYNGVGLMPSPNQVAIKTPTAGITPENKAGNVLFFGFNNGNKAFTAGTIKIYGKAV